VVKWSGMVAYGTDGGEGGEFEDVFDGGFGGIDWGRFDQGCVFDHDGLGEAEEGLEDGLKGQSNLSL